MLHFMRPHVTKTELYSIGDRRFPDLNLFVKRSNGRTVLPRLQHIDVVEVASFNTLTYFGIEDFCDDFTE